MKMKLHAVGDAKIPDFDRVYLQVVLPGGSVSKGTTKQLFFSKVHVHVNLIHQRVSLVLFRYFV